MSKSQTEGRAVPSRRISRLARFGGLGASVAGNMLADGAARLAKGERPKLNELLLTPKNASKVADQLSQLRGAAMKVGQLISMDGGDFVPPELAEILSKLRDAAHAMPPAQLKRVLNENWGRDWLTRFENFDVKPIAAASIGQVHRARTADGRDLAIKIQYPGVRQSIDSDVDNAASLLRLSGLTPEGVDISLLLEEAKTQLHQEADYIREAERLNQFRTFLADDAAFAIPEVHDDLTTRDILAMSYAPGKAIESAADAPQERRNDIIEKLMGLLLRELFEFKMVQTDPNFANYRIDKKTGKIVLLDFGATRDLPESLSSGYRKLIDAGIREDWSAIKEAVVSMGLAPRDMSAEHEQMMRDVFITAMEPMREDRPFDFADSDVSARLRDEGVKLRTSGFHHLPPAAAMFIHRKIGGIYLMAAKLKAKVNVHALTTARLSAD
ncbi:MAG: AarF/ABC1/UbiB kinase family protein [Pseudomonadota bacterium]